MRNIIIVGSSDESQEGAFARRGASWKPWRQESLQMEQVGVYDKIADEIDLSRSDTFLNICSGFSPMERKLIPRMSGAHFIGVEINENNVNTARSDLAAAKPSIPSHIFLGRSENDLFLDYDLPSRGNITKRSWESLRNQAILIHEDVSQSTDKVMEATNGEGVTHALFSFGGTPYLYAESAEQVAEKRMKTMLGILKLAAASVKTGGKYTQVERCIVPEGEEDDVLGMLSQIDNAIFQPFWKTHKPVRLMDADVGSIDVAGRNFDLTVHRKRVHMTTLERTDVPFDQEIIETKRKEIIKLFTPH